MAAELTVPAITIAIGEDFSFTAGLSVKINNTNKKLDETFVIPGVGPKTISMPAGPYLRIEATDVAIALKGFEFAADGIAIEQVTTKPATADHAGRQGHQVRGQRRRGQLRRRPERRRSCSP